MSAILYDKALLKKIKKWTEKTDVQIYGPSEANRVFQINADMHNDNPIKLPMIVLSRNGFNINNTNRQPINFDGKRIYAKENQLTQINAIPITLNYSLDVYSRYYDEADAYMRELIFMIINSPTVKVTLPYMDINYTHISNIRLSNNEVTDESLQVRSYRDMLCNLKINLNIDDAYIWDARIKSSVEITEDGLFVDTFNEKTSKIDSEIVNL